MRGARSPVCAERETKGAEAIRAPRPAMKLRRVLSVAVIAWFVSKSERHNRVDRNVRPRLRSSEETQQGGRVEGRARRLFMLRDATAPQHERSSRCVLSTLSGRR